MPTVFRIPVTRRLQLPVTLNSLLLGPLGTAMQFPVSISAHVLDPIRFGQPAGLDEYPASEVAAATEVIRSDMQRELDRRIGHRGRHERR